MTALVNCKHCTVAIAEGKEACIYHANGPRDPSIPKGGRRLGSKNSQSVVLRKLEDTWLPYGWTKTIDDGKTCFTRPTKDGATLRFFTEDPRELPGYTKCGMCRLNPRGYCDAHKRRYKKVMQVNNKNIVTHVIKVYSGTGEIVEVRESKV